MTESSASKTHSVEICREIQIAPDAFNIAPGKYISFGSFAFGNLNGSIRFYPHGNSDAEHGQCSIFVVLKRSAITLEDNHKNDNHRKIAVTIKCGSILNSFCQNASKFGGGGNGYINFASVTYMKANPLIYVTIKMKNDPQFVMPNTFDLPLNKQQELLYEFSKTDGDITLVISNDISIESQPVKKKRRLNNNCNNSTNQDAIPIIEMASDNEIKVSGIILKSASSVFKNMLTNNMMERNEKRIIICANDIESVDDMIYFMCTNKLRDDANAINVMELAHYYQMDRLKYECINRMINNISVDNFVESINVFDRYSIKDGYITLVEFAKENIDELKECETWDQLSHPFKMGALQLAKH